MPFESFGPTAFLHARRPTNDELESHEIIDITDPVGWNHYGSMHETKSIASMNISSSSHHLKIDNPLDDILLRYEVRQIPSLRINKFCDHVTPEYLAKIYNFGLRAAQQTIEASTCRYYRQVDEKGMTQRFRTSRGLFRYRQISMPVGGFYTDTFFAKVRSVRGFT